MGHCLQFSSQKQMTPGQTWTMLYCVFKRQTVFFLACFQVLNKFLLNKLYHERKATFLIVSVFPFLIGTRNPQ